jgi:hypothetical protein
MEVTPDILGFGKGHGNLDVAVVGTTKALHQRIRLSGGRLDAVD